MQTVPRGEGSSARAAPALTAPEHCLFLVKFILAKKEKKTEQTLLRPTTKSVIAKFRNWLESREQETPLRLLFALIL